jgi:hypothetical protein
MFERRNVAFRGAGIVFFCLILFSAAGPGVASPAKDESNKRMSIRLSGGAGWALDGGGDLELHRQGMVNYYTDINQLPNYVGHASWKKMSLIPEAQIELLFPLTSSLSVGLGSGYIRAKSKGSYGFTYNETGVLDDGSYQIDQTTNYTRDYTLSAIPVTLTLYLTMPAGRFNIYGYAGAGYYFGTLSHAYKANSQLSLAIYAAEDENYDQTDSTTGSEEAKKGGFGFHGGLGVEVKLGSRLALGLEVYGRYLNISGWTGSYNEKGTTLYTYNGETQTDTYSDNNTGTLKYYEIYDSDLKKYYAEMFVYNGDPSGEGVQNVRDAKVNFNAVGVRLSLRIFFNIR